jgi:transcription-repair coupling factor (superfamily II helicase)
MEYNDDIIRDAIIRELARDGQVFYLYNRVRTIGIKADQLQTLVPEARIGVAHGQMEERKLEEVMLDFVNKEFDVLVCTTIIESGLDMPNVNTLVIEEADRMGLAQLYQLRGRVGRSNRLAYAYITYKKDKILNEVAEKRLQTIKEFTEFGSGFKIAMRDMEIRGAGNLLGAEQHGHIETVGYDMYCRLLEEAVNEIEGKISKPETDVTVDLKVDAYIPGEYIENEKSRLEMYKKISLISDDSDVIDLNDELIDRYGDIPSEVTSLISVAIIKALAGSLNIISVSGEKDGIMFQLKDENALKMDTIGKIAGKYRREILFNAGKSPYILYKQNKVLPDVMLDNIKILLQDIKFFDTQ